MDKKYYTVIKIEGEYAYLRDDSDPHGEPLFIAMALLPLNVDIGTRLSYSFPDFEIV